MWRHNDSKVLSLLLFIMLVAKVIICYVIISYYMKTTVAIMWLFFGGRGEKRKLIKCDKNGKKATGGC